MSLFPERSKTAFPPPPPEEKSLRAFFEVFRGDIRIFHPNPATARFFHSSPEGVHGKSLRDLGFSPPAIRSWLHRLWDSYLSGCPHQFFFETAVSIPGITFLAEAIFLGQDPPERYFFSLTAEVKEGRGKDGFESHCFPNVPIVSSGSSASEKSIESRFITHEINNFHNTIIANHVILKATFDALWPVLERHLPDPDELLIAGQPVREMRSRVPKTLQAVLDGSKRLVALLRESSATSAFALRERKRVDLRALLRKVTILFSPILQQATRKFELDLPSDLPWVMGDALRLEQVFINLLRNSCQALSFPEEAISISASECRESKQVCISVSDEGKGISPHDRENLFNPGFSTRLTSGGTGVGLFICSKIIELHGGAITVESPFRQNCSGTRITVMLPIG